MYVRMKHSVRSAANAISTHKALPSLQQHNRLRQWVTPCHSSQQAAGSTQHSRQHTAQQAAPALP